MSGSLNPNYSKLCLEQFQQLPSNIIVLKSSQQTNHVSMIWGELFQIINLWFIPKSLCTIAWPIDTNSKRLFSFFRHLLTYYEMKKFTATIFVYFRSIRTLYCSCRPLAVTTGFPPNKSVPRIVWNSLDLPLAIFLPYDYLKVGSPRLLTNRDSNRQL